MSLIVPPTRYTPSARSPRSGDRFEQRTQLSHLAELVREALRLLVGPDLHPLELAQQVCARHDPDELLVTQHGDPAVLGGRHEGLQLRQGRALGRRDDGAAHDPANRSMGEAVAEGLVEVLAAHGADDAAVLGDEHAALPVPLAQGHRLANAVARARPRAAVGT